MAGAAAQGLTAVILTPAYYNDSYKSLLGHMLTGRSIDAAEAVLGLGLISGVIRSVNQWKGEEVSLLMYLNMDQAREALSEVSIIFTQHYPEHYAAWLLSLPDGEALLNSSLTLTGAPNI